MFLFVINVFPVKGDYFKFLFSFLFKGQEYLHQSTDNNIVFYNIETGESYTILSNTTMVCIQHLPPQESLPALH